MTRTRIAVIAVATALALTGCGAPAATPDLTDVDAELVALQAAGFAEDLTGVAPAPSASAGDRERIRPRAIRKQLRKNTLHGEMTVQAKDGVRTAVVQRGKVTAVTGSGVTVESTDGFKLTWTYGDKLRIVPDRSALITGAEVGVGGSREGDTTRARLIVVK